MALAELPAYPWDAMDPYAETARSHVDGIVDLSVGSPIDPTPAIVRAALADATDSHSYPATSGSPALRAAIVEWFARRRGVTSLTAANVLPTIGSKELVAWLPFLLHLGAGDVVVHPRAAYPTYAVGAVMAEATPFASDDPLEWPDATRLIWLNSPGNPDGRVLNITELRAAVHRARELGAVIVDDECYAELGWEDPWRDERIPSILDPRVIGDDLTGVLAAYSLSKQSNLAGYRAAFIAGDEAIIADLLTTRKHAGMMPPGPVQKAMTVALGDDAHVDHQKSLYRARRDALRPALESAGFRVERSEAGLYLWATRSEDAWASIGWLAERGILGGPGPFYGEGNEQFVRFSLTATDERIAAAVARLTARTSRTAIRNRVVPGDQLTGSPMIVRATGRTTWARNRRSL